MFGDMRIETAEGITDTMNQVAAAVMTRRLVAYPVEFRGVLVTVLGYARNNTEAVPLGIILESDIWSEIPQLSETHGPSVIWQK